jgi:hypothetical protein
VNLRDRLKTLKWRRPSPQTHLGYPAKAPPPKCPPPIPPHAAAQLEAAAKRPDRKRRDVQEVRFGKEQPSTVAALDDLILKHSHRLLQKVHLVVSVGPISPLTGLQSQSLRAEIGLAMREVAGAARWFERHKRPQRSVEVDGWGENEPTVKTTRPSRTELLRARLARLFVQKR